MQNKTTKALNEKFKEVKHVTTCWFQPLKSDEGVRIARRKKEF
jgi:hypothetical protein